MLHGPATKFTQTCKQAGSVCSKATCRVICHMNRNFVSF